MCVFLLTLAPALAQDNPLSLQVLGRYATGMFDESAAEIVAYNPASQSLFIVNGASDTIDIVNISDPANPALTTQVDVSAYGSPNSVAVSSSNLAAVALNAEATDGAGTVVFLDAAGTLLATVNVGVLPDMVTFTPDGRRALTANEGEPSDDYTVDPEGSVSIIDLSGGVETLTQDNVITLGFADFNRDGARAAELPAEVRIYGPNATVAQDLEPEYIAVSPDGTLAFVTLQENNAVAVLDIASATVLEIRALGFKDHSVEGSGLDASNEDGAINIALWPVFGMYQPDGIATFEIGGMVYYITANEGDTRDYEGYSEEGEVSEMTLDSGAFPDAATLQEEANLGKLEVVTSMGDSDGDGDYDALYVPGGRSFSIYSADGTLIYESGDRLEQLIAQLLPAEFNATNDENGSFDDRSDNKGPEPEDVEIGVIAERSYAFIGLERIGGVMVFDISDPAAPVFVTYANNRDFSGDAAAGTAGDLGPEGLLFIPAASSPNGQNLLVVANEISGSTTIFQISN